MESWVEFRRWVTGIVFTFFGKRFCLFSFGVIRDNFIAKFSFLSHTNFEAGFFSVRQNMIALTTKTEFYTQNLMKTEFLFQYVYWIKFEKKF